jgi:hypothetical protein
MPKKEIEFKNGDQVVACPEKMKDPDLVKKLVNHTGLTEEQLREGLMQVVDATHVNQLKIAHPRLKQPFSVHYKFIKRATAVA